MVKRPDATTASDYSQGLLTLAGTFHFARHLDSDVANTPAVDGAGNYVFEVWFDAPLTSASIVIGSSTLTFSADKGAFLVSGKLTATAATTAATTTDNSLATYPDADVGGASGTISVTSILGLAGTDETISLGTLTGGRLSINTATGLANLTTGKSAMTTATNIQGLGATMGASFVGANSLTLSGNVSITLGGSVAISLSGDVTFGISGPAASQVMTISLASGTVAFTAGTVTMTANVSGSFTIGASGFVASGAVSGLSTSVGGITFGSTSGTFSLDTTGATAAISVSATLDLTVTATGVSAGLHGTFTFDRSVLDTESVIRLSLTNGSTTFAAGTASLGITGINGAFVINSHGFAGRASVGAVTLTPGITGLTFTPTSLFFEINTTGDEINNLTIPGASVPLNFTGNDRKKFFRVQGTVALGLDLGGIAVSLDGTFYFEKYSADLDGSGPAGVTNVIKFAAIGANASFSTGNIKLEVTGVDGGFVIDNSGVAGFVNADAITATGLPAAITALTGNNLSFGINTTGHAVAASFGIAESGANISFDYSDANELSFVTIGGTINLGVSAGGASVAINGSIAFYGGTVDGNKVIKIGGENLTASVTVGPVTASITDVDFIFVVFDAGANSGVAGRITFQNLTFTGISNFTLTASGFSFEFNTTNMEIDEALDVGAVHQELKFTTADNELNFFRGTGTATLAFTSGAFSTTMSGTFGFEKLVMTTGGATVVKFAFTNVNFEIAVSTAKLKILDASGFFVFGNNTGGVASYAGQLKVTDAKLEGITGLDLQVSNFTFDVNNFGEAVKTNIGSTFALDFSASSKWNFLSLGGVVNLTITIGGFNATLTGGFFFEKSTETINGTPTTVMKVSVSDAGFAIGVGGASLTASGINGAFIIQGDGKSAGKLTIATVTLGISSSFHIDASTILLEFNNTGGALSASIPQAGGGSVALSYDATQTNFLKVGGTLGVTLKVGTGFEGKLSGTFYFEQNAGNMMVAFKDVYLSVQVSSVKLEVNNLNGALIAYGDGTIAASIKVGAATIPDPSNPTGPPLSAVRLTGVNGLTFEVTNFLFEINTKSTDVDVVGTFADGSAWGVKVGHNTIRVGGGLKLGLTIGSFEAKLEGSFYFEQNPDFMVVAFKDVSMSVAVSTVKLEVNNLNGAFVAYNDGTMAASIKVGALTNPDGSPAVKLSGVNGLTFEVTNFLLEINTKAVAHADVDGDGHDDGDVNVDGTFADGSAWGVHVGADTLRVGGALKLGLTIGTGFEAKLEGAFYFEQNPDFMVVAFKDVNMSIAVSTVKLEVNNLNGAFVIYDDGTMAASIAVGALTNPDGSPAVKLSGITGLTFEVTNFLFEINTKAVAGVDADGDGHDDGDVNIDGAFADGSAWGVHVGADTIRVGGALKLNVKIGSAFEANIEGAVYFEQNPDYMVVAFKDVNLSIAVSTVKLEVNNFNGAFVVYDDGTLAASLTVGAVTNPDGSPAVKLSGISGLKFEVTNFLFEINTKAVAGVDADADGHDDGDVNIDGTFADGTAWGVHVGADTIRVGGALKLNLKVGSAFEANLEGAFYFEQNPNYMVVAFKDVSMSIAVSTVKLEINNLNGTFVAYNDGTMAASLKVGALTNPDGSPAVKLSGVTGLTFEVTNFLFEINTKAVAGVDADGDGHDDNDVDINGTFADGSAWGVKVGADTLRVGGALKLGLALGGFEAKLEGAFYFEQNPGFMVVAFKDVSMSIGVGTSVKFEVNNLSGALVSYPGGPVAVSLTIGSLTTPDPANPTGPPLPAVRLTGIPGFTFEVTTFLFQINTSSTTNVNVDGNFADGSAWGVHVNANTIKVGGGLKMALTVGSFTGKLQAEFYFAKEQIGGVDTIKVSVTNGSLLLSVGAAISISGVNGAFVILPDGSAGKLSISTIALTGVPAFSLEVIDLYMEFNNTGRDITMDVPVASGPDIHLSFVNVVNQPDRHNFFLISGSIRIKVGGTPAAPFLTIETLDLKVDTGATGIQHLFEAKLLRGTLNIPALGGSITIEAGNLAITAEGKLANLVEDPDGAGPDLGSVFYVRVTFGAANAGQRPDAGSFQWPSWMPIKIQEITLAWGDVGNHPDQFILVISAELGPIPGLTTVNFTGLVKNLRIDVYKLTHPGNGFPVLGFDAAAIEISGNLFGMQISGGVVMGMIDFRADGTIIDRSNVANLTEIADGTIFYFGLRAHVTIGNIGAGFSIGMADIDPGAGVNLVPLEAMISVEAPVIIEPISGLTLGAFTARIQFASTLQYSTYGPDPLHPEIGAHTYAEIDELRAVTISSATNPSLSQWEAGLRVSTLALYRSASPSGAVNVWDKPMVITAAVTLYSSYVSREALNGTLMLKFDTEGRMLLVGELLFGGGNMKLDAKMYANFSNVSGGFEFTFYGSMGPTAVNPKPFEIWGALSIKIYDLNHNQLGSPANAQAIDYEAAHPGTPALASQAGYLEIAFTGGVQFSVGTAIIAKAEGTLKLEVDFHTPGVTVTKLTFDATLSLINPNPNPLGPNFAEITGTVILKVGTGNTVELYGALLLHFNGNALRAYGIDVNSADIFLQLNTTGTEKTVTLDFASAPDIDVVLRPTSFSLYIKGDIGFGTPPANASDPNSVTHLIELKGFLILEIDASGMTLAVYADITLAPGGQELMKFNVTGFLRIQYDGVHDGVAAKLKLVRSGGGSIPGVDFSGSSTFFLMFNTTGAEVTYTIPDWFYAPGDPHLPDIVIPESAPAFGGDLSVPADATAPPEAYFVIYVDGSLTAMGGTFTLSGEFFIVITPTQFLLQVDADLEIGPSGSPFITFTATGFMKISADGIAARLDLGLAASMPSELSFSAGFQLILNTTGQIQTYQAHDSAGVLQTYTIAQAAPEIGGNLQVAADIDNNPATTTPGSPYFLLAMQGNLTALSSFTLIGDFFIVITTGKVQLQVNASLTLAGISLSAHGFLEVSSEGAAGLLEISTSLSLPGITIVNAKFFVAFNTFSSDYVLPASVITQFQLANDQTKLDHGLIRIQVSGTVRIGSVFELDGFFFFEHTPSHDILTVQAKASLPIVGDLAVSGTLIMTSAGAVGSLTITISTGNRSALSAIGLTFNATMSLKVNTTSAAVDDPDNTDPAVMIDADTVQIDLNGSLTVLGVFTFQGHFFFKKSGAQLNIRFNAELNIDVIGRFTVTGAFNSGPAGFTGELGMTFIPGSGITSLGFSISGTFIMAINTTASNYTPTISVPGDNGGVLLPGSLRIFVTGSLSFFGALTISGTFSLSKTPSSFEVYVNAQLDLGGIFTLDVVGWLGIYSDGIAARLSLGVKTFNFEPVFKASGNFTFEINTSSSQEHLGIRRSYLKVSVDSVDLELIYLFKFHGSFSFVYDAGVWTVSFSASTTFLGLATATASGIIRSDGYYSVDVGGSISIGVSGFGIFGSFSFHIDGIFGSVKHISGNVNGHAELFGLSFGLSASFGWSDTDPNGDVWVHAEISIDFFFFSITFGATFVVAHISGTTTYQAGLQNNPRVWDDGASGGVLYVNVGDTRAAQRNFKTGDINEQVVISQTAAGIIIDVLGQKNLYKGVTKVIVNTGSGSDYVMVDSTVTVPVEINLGDGDDFADINSNGNVTIWGGNGRDTINGGPGKDVIYGEGGNDLIKGGGGDDIISGGDGDDIITGGTGNDTLTGDAGNDSFMWTIGDGVDQVIDGGTGTNSLSLDFNNNANGVTVTGVGNDFAVNYGSTSLTGLTGLTNANQLTNINSLFLNLRGGADTVSIGYFGAASNLDSLGLALGDGDNAADTVILAGSGSNDIYRVTSTLVSHQIQTGVDYTNPLAPVKIYSTYNTTSLLVSGVNNLDAAASFFNVQIEQGGGTADQLVINAGNGDDVVDAHNVVNSAATLTLNGEAGNDRLVGSSFDDFINGGTGSDTLTGGPGADTFTDTSLNPGPTDDPLLFDRDEIVETQNVDFTLNAWTLTAGGVQDYVIPSVFESIRLNGGTGNNTFTISNVATTVTLNGGDGSDTYLVTIAGSGISLINIFDDGAGGSANTDMLKIYGTSGADNFQLRDGVISAGNDPGVHVETIKFTGMNAFEIWAGAGNDNFIIDETVVGGTIYGEGGADTFLVGRIVTPFGTPAPDPTVLKTIATTRGALAYGNRALLTINGGTGDDYFEVNHNQAELRLNGDDGDDTFYLKTYLKEGSALSNVTGGTGVNTIQYVNNGPVKINGGAGFDKLILEGTEADDVFIVTDTDIFGGGRSISFTNIESIQILGGPGNDTVWVLGNGLPLEINGGSGDDIVNIGGQAPDYVYDAPEVVVDDPPYTVSTPIYWGGFDFTFTQAAHFEFNGSFPFFHWVPEITYTISIPRILIGYTTTTIDPDPVTYDPLPVTYRFANVTNFNGVVNGVETYNWAGPRDETKTVANDPNNPFNRTPGVSPNTRKNLGTINAPIKVIGGTDNRAGENDVLNINIAGTTGDLTARLFSTIEHRLDPGNVNVIKDPVGQLLGLGIPDSFTVEGRTFMGGILFDSLESLVLNLGSGNDSVTIGSNASDRATVAGYPTDPNAAPFTNADYDNGTFGAVNVTVNGNGGNDTVNLRANTGIVTFNGAGGSDVFNLGSNASNASNTGGNLDALVGGVVFDGGAGSDSLNLDDRGDTTDNVLTLTQTTLAGLGMGAGITSYTGIESLFIGFGSGADIANIRGTAVATTLELNDGDDSIYVSSIAAVTTANRAATTTLGGHLDDVDGALLIQGGNGRQRLMASDRDTASANGTAGTPAVITNSTLTGFSTGVITYTASPTGDYGNGITVWTGSGADFVNVTSIFLRPGIRNSTSLNTGAGVDTINVNLPASPNAFFAVHAGAGNDIISTVLGTLGVLIFGGDGDDSITTGLGSHLIFGDEGTATYLDGSGNLVARYGSGGVDDFTDAVIRDLSTAATVVSVGGNDTITTNAGNDILFGGAGADTINAGEGDNIVFGDHGNVLLAGGLATNVTSNLNGGGNDSITTGAGRDLIVGGTGADTINGGAGFNFVLGDHGSITLAANIVTALATTDSADGGADTITTLGGRDFILGGEAGDNINAGEGDNVVAGDQGSIAILSVSAFTFTASSFTVGGNDTITTGAGADTIIGGFGADTINGGDGFNVVFGDHGTVDRNVATGAFTVTSSSEATGGNDSVTTGSGVDVIFGGAASDTIISGAGGDIVFGDAGTVTFASGLVVSAATTAFDTGAGDNIQSGDDADVVLGGDGADTIDAGNGSNLVFGDYGSITWTGTLLVSASATAAGTGGIDSITTGSDDDIIFGGTAGDTIHAGAGADVVFGDEGLINFTSGLATSLSNVSATGDGSDTIFGEAGNDVILGGGAGDTIDAGGDHNTVVGDHATIVRAVNGAVLATVSVTSADQGVGGNDSITSGSGNDWIIGGAGADTISAGEGANVVFGDEGQLTTQAFLLLQVISTTTNAGADTINSGSGTNYIVGGAGTDTITVGGGTSVILGDQGQIDWSSGVLIDATTFGANTGAADVITVGNGTTWVFGGDGDDSITAGNGFVVAFGDHGSIDLTGAGVLTVTSLDFTSGGDDTLTTGDGDDIILGGFGSDTIVAGDGNNVVFGDHGEVIKTSAGLDWVTTLAPTQGAADTITTGAGNDVILGGAGNDTIHAGAGRNLIFGDHGSIDFTANDARVITSSDYTIGGDDTIDSGLGDDVIFGGFGTDDIDAGDGANVVLGDQGTVNLSGGVLIDVLTEQSSIGAADIIVSGSGRDIVLGGAGADTIKAGNGDNVVIGDHAELYWIVGILARAISTNFSIGANDNITAGSGDDVIIAGPANDTVNAGDGNNLVFGDNASITWTAGVIVQATTEDSLAVGGNDTITTGAGRDLIVGGAGLDAIHGGAGADVIFGDNGDARFSGGLLASLQTLSPADSAGDTIYGDAGDDIILAGQGSDTISGGDDNDIILGDEGRVLLSSGVVQSVTSESFADGSADTISGDNGNDFIIGGNGADTINGGEGNNVIVGDNALFTMPGAVLAQVEVLTPDIGAVDTITAGAGDDVIMGGALGDIINGGNGNNVVIGDHGTITFLSGVFATFTPTTPGIGGNDQITTGSGADRIVGGTGADWIDAGDGNNVVVGDHAVIIQNNGALTRVESVAFADGGVDLIFTGSGNDLILGGTGGDTIHAGAGNDLVFGDHALVSGDINLALLPLAMAVHPFTFTSISTQNLGADGRSVAGDDVIFAGAGDDIVLGQQGNDILFGEDGNDDLIGGHNVSLGQDGADVIDGGAGYDVIAGDNASVLRRGDNISPRAHVLAGDAMFDDRGNLLDLDTPQAWPGNVLERDTIILDHAYGTDATLFGNDQLVGGAGDDVLFGELGDDQLHGDATLPVTVAADGTIDRTALRATATALFTTNFWVGDATDGDDYIEGNGGADLIFGGLGQDDIVGGSSSLFGLTDRLQRPDGADTIYGGNGTQASDQSPGDSSLNGRARDADVIMGDNANIIRLVGINGINFGAFLTFQYNTTGTLRIVVRGFDLLDYTIPAATSDIGAADTISGEDGDDTLHGEVGDDLMYGNGNDDNLYGGQGDDNLFGGAGDDSISHSDELKAPPPAQGSGGAAEGTGAEGTAPGTIPLNLPGNVEIILGGDTGTFRLPIRTDIFVSRFGTNIGQPGQILNTPVGMYRQTRMATDMQGSWRVFSSGMISTGRDFAPNTPSFFDEAAGANREPQKKDDEQQPPADNPATPQDESQPAVPADQQNQNPPAPQDGQTPPADQPAPADTTPAQGENPPPENQQNPPAPQGDGNPPVPPTNPPPAPPAA